MNQKEQLKQLLGTTNALLEAMRYSTSTASGEILKSLLQGAIGYAEDEAHNLKDFIQANLRKAVFVVPDKEIEIQNGIESLMVGRGMAKGTDYDA